MDCGANPPGRLRRFHPHPTCKPSSLMRFPPVRSWSRRWSRGSPSGVRRRAPSNSKGNGRPVAVPPPTERPQTVVMEREGRDRGGLTRTHHLDLGAEGPCSHRSGQMDVKVRRHRPHAAIEDGGTHGEPSCEVQRVGDHADAQRAVLVDQRVPHPECRRHGRGAGPDAHRSDELRQVAGRLLSLAGWHRRTLLHRRRNLSSARR